MALTIVTTVGGASSNSYVSVAEAVAHFEGRLRSDAWDNATDTDQMKALVSATGRLDQEEFQGCKTDSDQALKWPRYGAEDPDGVAYDSDAIPREIKTAVYKLALALLAGDLLVDSGMEGFENIVLGPLEVTPRTKAAGALPADVRREIAHVLTTPASNQIRFSR